MAKSRRSRRLRELLSILLILVTVPAVVAFGGPLASGALFLLRPAPRSPEPHDLPADYAPHHQGGVDLSTGLYVRTNEDLVIGGTPALILRRTYRTRDHVQRSFGVGAAHPGERYLHGEVRDLSRASVILADGSRVEFARTSFGNLLSNAFFEYRGSRPEYQGAQLGWTGFGWAIRHGDGALSRYQQCGPGIARSCSVESDRDADGHTIHYRRNTVGRLVRMEADGDRWIAFGYDAADRVVRVVDSKGRQVEYDYDVAGRLIAARSSGGGDRRYSYTDAHELRTIEEPGVRIENIYESGRCVRQLNWFPGASTPYVFEFAYQTERDRVIQTTTRESSGAWSRTTFDDQHAIAEEGGYGDRLLLKVHYDRDAQKRVRRVTVECRDSHDRSVSTTRAVMKGDEKAALASIVRTRCAPPHP